MGLSCSTFETVGPRDSAPERMVFNENLQSCLSTTRNEQFVGWIFMNRLFQAIQRLQHCSPPQISKKKHRPIWNFLAPNKFVPFHRDGIWQWQTNLLTVCKRVDWVALQLKVSGPEWYHHQGQVSSWWHGSVFISALVHHWFIIGSSWFIIASSCSVIASLCFVVVLSCYIIDSSLSHHILLFLIPIGERIWLACSCFSKPGSPCKSASFFLPLKNPRFFCTVEDRWSKEVKKNIRNQ